MASVPTPTPAVSDEGVTSTPVPPWKAAPVPFWVSVAGAVLMLLGLVLPWARIDFGIHAPVGRYVETQAAREFERQLEAETGYELGTNTGLRPSEGRAVLALGTAFALALAVHLSRGSRGRALPIVMVVLAALAALVAFGEVADLSDAGSSGIAGVDVHVGSGVWISALASVLAAAGAVLYLRLGRSRGEPSAADADVTASPPPPPPPAAAPAPAPAPSPPAWLDVPSDAPADSASDPS